MRLKAFDYRYNANNALEGKKIFAVLVTIVFQILTGIFSSVVSFFLEKYIGEIIFFDRVIIFISCMSIVYALFFVSPLSYGYLTISKKIYRNQKANVGDLFDGFSNYRRVFTLNLLLFVKTFLWTLLFYIPGIIKAYAYSMSNYILDDNPNMRPKDAIAMSVKLMKGNKFRLFCLHFSFIGWIFLSILTCGILIFYVTPYIQVAQAAFYDDLIQNQTTPELE